MKRSAIPARLRAACFANANGKCELCGAGLTDWHCDHVNPHFFALGHDAENLQALCHGCHKIKTAADMGKIAKTRRLIARENGTRRVRKPIQSPGFSKTFRRKFDGTIERR